VAEASYMEKLCGKQVKLKENNESAKNGKDTGLHEA
jgi:hypothetical protein